MRMRQREQSKRGSRLVRRASAFLIGLVSLITLWQVVRGQHTLLERSVAVYRPADTKPQWLSDHELLLFKSVSSKPKPWSGGDALENNHGWRLTRLDTSTGKEAPLTALSRWLPHRSDAPDNAAVSPDGRWLLWRKGRQVVAARLDGAQRRTWDDSANPSNCRELPLDLPHWQQDSRHFCEPLTRHFGSAGQYEYVGAALIRDVQNPQSNQVVEFPLCTEFGPTQYYESPHVTLTGDMLAVGPAWERSAAKTLVFAPLQAGKPPRKLRIHAPRDLEFSTERSDNYTAVALSPNGERIAWICVAPARVPPFLALLHRIFPGPEALPRRTLSLWVSRSDGSEMSELGEIVISANEGGVSSGGIAADELQGISNLRWLPSGKALSFEYRDTLYRMQAPP